MLNKVQKVYVEVKKDSMTVKGIAKDLGVDVKEVERYVTKLNKAQPVESPAQEHVATQKKSKLDTFARVKDRGVVSMTPASSQTVDDNRGRVPSNHFNSGYMMKIKEGD